MARKNQVFQYDGIDQKNNRITGEIAAISPARARLMLQAQGINPLTVKKKVSGFFSMGHIGKVKKEEITAFSRQMATMLTAGIPLVQGLTIIVEGSPTSALADLVRKIKVDVESGTTFSVALKKNPQYFDELFCNLIASGEQSGALDTMLNRVAFYQEKSDSLRRKIKKAMYYPAAVILIAGIVTAILLIKVVPTFQQLFASSGHALPAFTQLVVNISKILQHYWFYVITFIVLIIYTCIWLYKNNVLFQHFIQRSFLKLPIFGKIIRKTIIARFARTLSTTCAAGVPLPDALEAVAKATGNVVYAKAITDIKEGLSAGQQMHIVMRKTEVFPVMVVQMVGIGEQSGALEEMLGKVATIYEEEVDTAVDGLTTLLEPLIMLILGVVVGGLVIAMYLPIFKLGSAF
jgi:type IV pilus assembly protein PilC